MTGAQGIELYRSPSGDFEIAVRTDSETVWVSADQLVELFGRDKSTISRHLRNVFGDGELDRAAVVADFATTAADGKTYRVAHYNHDVVLMTAGVWGLRGGLNEQPSDAVRMLARAALR